MVNQRLQNAVLVYNLKKKTTTQKDLCSWKTGMISDIERQTIQYHSNPSLCPDQYAEEAEVERFYEDMQDLLELTPRKDVLFIMGD